VERIGSRTRLFFGLLLSLASCGSAYGDDAPLAQRFTLPSHGALELRVPPNWIAAVRIPTDARPRTIVFAPRDGVPFEVSLTPSWDETYNDSSERESAMRRRVGRAVEAIRANIVEKEVPLVKLRGASGYGLYFSATDKAPKSMEYKFVTQGTLGVGDISADFTILTYDGQQEIVKNALAMLATARHVPTIASGIPTAR
jgi:hypothetical protein